MEYRNFAYDENITTLSVSKSFITNWDLPPIDFVTGNYGLRDVFNKSILLNVIKQEQNVLNVEWNMLSEIVCVFITTNILSLGKWNYVACDERIQMPYVICEKMRTNISHKNSYNITRTLYECHSGEVTCMINGKQRCLSLKKYCLPSALADVTFQMSTEDVGYNPYLGKWTMGLTFEVGYMMIDSNNGLCLNKIQECCYYKQSNWEKGIECSLKKTSYWRCVTSMKMTSQLCKTKEFQCQNGDCILNQYRCDNIPDCLDGSDEAKCGDVCTSNFTCFADCKFPDCSCSSSYIQNRNSCEPLYQRYRELLSISNLNIIQIDEIQQHIFTSDVQCPSGWALCTIGDTGACYPYENICVFERNILGAPLYCKNTEHLTACYDHQCPTLFKCKETFCIPIYMLCDGISDCPDQEDETYTLCKYNLCINVMIK